MQLHVHEVGDGPKTAILVHGMFGDHRAWHAVERNLIGRGYRVLAPDLRGHGLSPRGTYAITYWADDLVESLPVGADLALGHSLGGMALGLAVGRLLPKRAVYSDPSFVMYPRDDGQELVDSINSATAEACRAENPLWSDADIEASLAAYALVDRYVASSIGRWSGYDVVPDHAVVPSLVQVAQESLDQGWLADAPQRLVANGFELRVVDGVGHCIHRDDLNAFMASLEGWI